MQMIRAYISTKSVDGHYAGLLLSKDGTTAELLIPCRAEVVKVPVDSLRNGREIEYRPTVVRRNLLNRIAVARKYGHALPKKSVLTSVLKELGASERRICEAQSVEPVAQVVERRTVERVKRERRFSGGVQTLDEARTIIAARIDGASAGRELQNGRPLPKVGTGARRVVDALLAAAEGPGCTDADLCLLYGYEPGTFAFGRDLKRYAERYGMVAYRQKDEAGVWRMKLLDVQVELAAAA